MNGRKYLYSALILLLATETAIALKLRHEISALTASLLTTDEKLAYDDQLKGIARQEQIAKAELASITSARAHSYPGEALVKAAARVQPPSKFNLALQDPAFRKLLTEQQRALLDLKYASLAKSLGLSAEQLEKFKDLLVDKQISKADAVNAAISSAIAVPTYSDNYKQVVLDAQADANGQIQAVLGEAAFAQYQHFEETYSTRLAVQRLQQTLGYTATSMTTDQIEQLTDAWYGALPSALQGNTTGSGINFSGGNISADAIAPLPAEAATVAQSILTPDQLKVVESLQEVQQDESRLRELADAGRGK